MQRGQLVAELDSERRNSLEAGIRVSGEALDVSASTYAARSTDLIFRDAQGLNVSEGRTKSVGIELETELRTAAIGSFEMVGSWARHEYDFNRRIGGGEIIESGQQP